MIYYNFKILINSAQSKRQVREGVIGPFSARERPNDILPTLAWHFLINMLLSLILYLDCTYSKNFLVIQKTFCYSTATHSVMVTKFCTKDWSLFVINNVCRIASGYVTYSPPNRLLTILSKDWHKWQLLTNVINKQSQVLRTK